MFWHINEGTRDDAKEINYSRGNWIYERILAGIFIEKKVPLESC